MDLILRQQKKGNPLQDSGLKSRGILIPGKESRVAFLFNKWILISFAALVLGLIVFGGLKGYDFYLQKNIGKLEQEIQVAQNQQNTDMIQKVMDLDKSISTVKDLLKNHIYSSLFFEKLEKLTLPQVQWISFTLNVQEGTADLIGKAASYSYLAKQIVSFQDAKFEISVSGIGLKKDGVEFSARIKFDPTILKNK